MAVCFRAYGRQKAAIFVMHAQPKRARQAPLFRQPTPRTVPHFLTAPVSVPLDEVRESDIEVLLGVVRVLRATKSGQSLARFRGLGLGEGAAVPCARTRKRRQGVWVTHRRHA